MTFMSPETMTLSRPLPPGAAATGHVVQRRATRRGLETGMDDRSDRPDAGPAFTRQIARLRRVAARLQAQDPEGAAACLFAASVLSNLPQDTGVGGERIDLPGVYTRRPRGRG